MSISAFFRLVRGPGTSARHVVFSLRCCWGLGAWALMACQSSPAPEGAAASGSPTVQNLFPLQLPADFKAVQLRGEGSEFLRAPIGAKATEEGDEFSLNAGVGFALRVRTVAPSLSKLAERWSNKQIAFRAEDAVIVKEKGAYGLIVVRQLVPEWDENDRRQYSCSTPGMLSAGTPLTTFSPSEVGAMVAACRSLSLPVLE